MQGVYQIGFEESMNRAGKHCEYCSELSAGDKDWALVKKLYEDNYLNFDGKSHSIPKIIHQIWLGSDLPAVYKKWQKSWKKFHPDWEYMLWTDESVKDLRLVNETIFHSTKNLGAKSDILRYELLARYGGLYVDTDFECLKSFDFLNSICDFYTGAICSRELCIANGLIGTIPDHPIILNIMESISSGNAIATDDADRIMKTVGPVAFTACFLEHCNDLELASIVFPSSFFYPFPGKLREKSKKAARYIEDESHALHYWEVSWQKRSMGKIFRRFLFKHFDV